MQDNVTRLLVRGIAQQFLGDMNVPGGIIRGTWKISDTKDTHIINIELFPIDIETGEQTDKSVAKWQLTLDRVD